MRPKLTNTLGVIGFAIIIFLSIAPITVSVISIDAADWQGSNIIKPISVFCLPTTSPTQMFSYNWCIW